MKKGIPKEKDELGSGSFGEVKIATLNNQLVAVKHA